MELWIQIRGRRGRSDPWAAREFAYRLLQGLPGTSVTRLLPSPQIDGNLLKPMLCVGSSNCRTLDNTMSMSTSVLMFIGDSTLSSIV